MPAFILCNHIRNFAGRQTQRRSPDPMMAFALPTAKSRTPAPHLRNHGGSSRGLRSAKGAGPSLVASAPPRATSPWSSGENAGAHPTRAGLVWDPRGTKAPWSSPWAKAWCGPGGTSLVEGFQGAMTCPLVDGVPGEGDVSPAMGVLGELGGSSPSGGAAARRCEWGSGGGDTPS
jgi:hypothetical protein